jgi:hypothetical protein
MVLKLDYFLSYSLLILLIGFLLIYDLHFYYYHWVDTSAGGLLVSEGIIHLVVSASALTWFIRYI